MIITLDGPTASGKSTISRMLAEKLGYYYINSGLLFRAIAYLLSHKFEYSENTIINPQHTDVALCLDPQRFFYQYHTHDHARIFFDGLDITPYLKDGFIDTMASLVSTHEYVRSRVACIQREIASDYNVVVEGRDVGSIVFADAAVKIFLTATEQVRSQRWQKYQKSLGNEYSSEQALKSIHERDERDKNRAVAPLVIPDDAIIIDSSSLTLKETVDKIVEYMDRALQTL